MDLVVVNLSGLAVIVWIVWYFFLSRRAELGAAVASGGFQEVQVTVKGGYVPEVIAARPGVPLRIRFRREETSACSEEVVFPDFGIRRALPAFETTVVELPASAAGRYGFACGMDMMHGTLVLAEPTEPAAGPAHVVPAPTADPRATWPVDPVCGMRVDPEKPAATAVRDGQTVYFCNVGCKETFESGGRPGTTEHRVRLGVRHRH